jgi:chitinase
MKPKPDPDGSCSSYTVKDGDRCAKIAASYGLTADDIETLNKGTWRFTGCSNLFVGINICLSTGEPPMPAPISNAVCGPQVPGTTRPSDTSREALAVLNPCPLNICCNIWGQCGTTGAFCTVTGDGTPGDVEPGTSGCVNSCGTEIVNNGESPAEFRSIAYFEAWNGERPCLYMNVEDINKNSYTHIHFSFIDLTTSYGVSTANVQVEFDKFVKMTGIKRIVAFGGWTASTHPSTYYLFRDGVAPANRETLASNLAAFVNKYDLDGIDIDWEYPSAPDLPDIPPADPLNGQHYLEFLTLLREKLPDKSISVAAPASYCYLKGFPIAKISDVVDYIVYMTYDLHGQWDFGSQWSQEVRSQETAHLILYRACH